MSFGIRSRFFALLAVLVLAFSALPLTAGAAAAGSVTAFESVIVSAHNEQQGAMLFITGTLPADAALPADVELAAPAGSQLQWAGEILGGDLADDISVQPRSSETSGGILHAFTLTKARVAQLETLASGVFQNGPSVTDVKLVWTPTADVASVVLQVRLPQSAGISVPVEGAETHQADPGFVYYSKTFPDAKAGQPLELALSYVPGASGTSGAPGAAGTKANSPMPFVVVVVALLAFVWFGMKVSNKAAAARLAEETAAGGPVRQKRAVVPVEPADEDYDDDDTVLGEGDAADEDGEAVEIDETPQRSKLPLYLTLGVVVLVAVLVFITSTAGGGVGVKQVTADSVSKIVANVDANAALTVPVVMTEGGDVEHESDHVFQALQTTIGVRKVSVALDGRSVTVDYDSAQVGEEQIKQALAAGGYPPQQ